MRLRATSDAMTLMSRGDSAVLVVNGGQSRVVKRDTTATTCGIMFVFVSALD
jgi:hypothetical protein